ncbi:MAG: glutamate decarboxylase [Bacillota bacterium]
MWTVVYIAPNRIIAEQLKQILVAEGVLVNLRSSGVPHLGDSGSVEILVPESEIEEAHEILSSAMTK